MKDVVHDAGKLALGIGHRRNQETSEQRPAVFITHAIAHQRLAARNVDFDDAARACSYFFLTL